MTLRPLAYAFGNARVRAMRSRLARPRELAAMRAARSVAAVAEAAGLEATSDVGELARRAFERLLEDYRKILAAYPAGRELFESLLGLHEIENLKLAWRALSRGFPPNRWVHLWKPLGRLERLPLAPWRGGASLPEAVKACRRTPYAALLSSLASEAAADPAIAEMRADRWAWERLLCAARRLPRAERDARQLALARVADRDADFVARAAAWRLDPSTAEAAALIPVRRAERLAAATRARMRREKAERAFVGPPFRLGPAVALLWLREQEVRAIEALARSIEHPAPAALGRVLAASAMGS